MAMFSENGQHDAFFQIYFMVIPLQKKLEFWRIDELVISFQILPKFALGLFAKEIL